MTNGLGRLLLLVPLCAAWFLATVRCRGNDVAFGGAGADLIPQADARVRMLSEDILLTREAPGGYEILGEGYWTIRATYRLRNQSSEGVSLQIGFPEPACLEEEDCGFEGFENLTTTVRGKPAKLTAGKVRRDHDWADRVGKVHLFDVTFEPRETVEIVHAYRHGLSEHAVGGENLRYVTVTGEPWADTIGNARFRILLPFRPWGIILGAWGPQLTGLAETRSNGKSRVEIVLEQADWEPEENLELYFGPGHPTPDSPPLVEGCPDFFELLDGAETEQDLDAAELSERTRAIPTEKLRDCRNAIFAHHGYIFRDEQLNRRFYGNTGLRVTANVVFARNPEFTAEMLTAPEDLYVKAIRMIEQVR